MALVLGLIAVSLEFEIIVILESGRMCRIQAPNKNTLKLKKRSVNFYLLFFFLLCFNPNVRQSGIELRNIMNIFKTAESKETE